MMRGKEREQEAWKHSWDKENCDYRQNGREKINQKNQRYKRKRWEKRKREKEIAQQIEMIPNANQYRILYNRYVLCKDWNVISVEMGCTFRNAMSIHGRALQEFEKYFGSYYL